MNILIGGAWPYANGSLHIGHIAALLPGDILARYFRLKGENVCYVSGSDCHGTPIQIRAKEEGTKPEKIAERHHKEFKENFNKLGFSYDIYHTTQDQYHKDFVQGFFTKLWKSGYVYRKSTNQTYCESCCQFLPDRFVTGLCPNCGKCARGDQCDACGSLIEPEKLKDIKCDLCGHTPVFKQTGHLYMALSKFQHFLTDYISGAQNWRENAVNLSQRYISEGLKDRALTRDLEWGIDVPLSGFEGKKIYVWIEAVLGYLSASKKWLAESGGNWDDFWGENAVHYYVHGKDNIPFHTIILPALLQAAGGLHLPDRIIASEHVTLEGKKISTSNHWGVWIPYLLEHYHADSIRYFFIINGPEKRDIDFSWREFINSHNGELLGAFGNFVNRTFVFIQKYFDGKVPEAQNNPKVKDTLTALYPKVGRAIEQGRFKDALEAIFTFIRSANKYFDEEQPWITVKENTDKCKETLHTCVQIIANLSILLEPFLPFSSAKLRSMLRIEETFWNYVEIPGGLLLEKVEMLFDRIDKKMIREEEERLKR